MPDWSAVLTGDQRDRSAWTGRVVGWPSKFSRNGPERAGRVESRSNRVCAVAPGETTSTIANPATNCRSRTPPDFKLRIATSLLANAQAAAEPAQALRTATRGFDAVTPLP